jgi:multicomponent Na+:H+ antiporter subunit C
MPLNPDTSPNVTLVVVIAALVTVGVYLLLERSLSRVLIGVILIGNAANLLFLVAGGAAGRPPFVGSAEPSEMSDPLPQAMALTAIVITLAMTAFLLAMAYRSWQLHRHDEVQDDVEDRRIARLAAIDERATTDADTEDTRSTLDEEAAETRDETDEAPSERTTPVEVP